MNSARWRLIIRAKPETPSKGDLYVADFTAKKVYRFKYESGTKKAVEVGTPISLEEPTAVAVNSKGDVYVADYVEGHGEEGYVNEYGPTSTLLQEKRIDEPNGGLEGPHSLALDASGNIYLASKEGVRGYTASGACLKNTPNPCARTGSNGYVTGVAVGPEGDIYEFELEPLEEEVIKMYEPSGTKIESFDSTHLIKEANGIAVSGTTVYVTNTSGNEVAVFTPGAAEFELKVKLTGTGTGEVKCQLNETGTFTKANCEGKKVEGTKITTEGVPAGGSAFGGWTAGTGSASVCPAKAKSNCTFELKEESTITAEFTLKEFELKVKLTGTGTGEVKCQLNETGTFTKANCEGKKVEGTKITTEGVPAGGSAFGGWTAGTGSGECVPS